MTPLAQSAAIHPGTRACDPTVLPACALWNNAGPRCLRCGGLNRGSIEKFRTRNHQCSLSRRDHLSVERPSVRAKALVVVFQQVVHSVLTEETGITRPQHPQEGPNEHPQECPFYATWSRAAGSDGRERTQPVGGGARRHASAWPVIKRRDAPAYLQDMVDQVIDLRRQRLTGSHIARKVGISPATVGTVRYSVFEACYRH